MIKFPRHLNPAAVTEQMMTTPQLKSAWVDLMNAIREHEKLGDAREIGTAKLKQQHLQYAAALKDAVTSGDDLSKIKAPPSTFDATAIDAQQKAWADKAIETAELIRDLLLNEAAAAGNGVLEQLEAAEREVFDALEIVKQKIARVDDLNRLRSFYRRLQLFPDDIPNVSQAPMPPSNALTVSSGKEVREAALKWRLHELDDQARLGDAAIRKSDDPAERAALDDAYVVNRREIAAVRDQIERGIPVGTN